MQMQELPRQLRGICDEHGKTRRSANNTNHFFFLWTIVRLALQGSKGCGKAKAALTLNDNSME
jgi:hypothetical protein